MDAHRRKRLPGLNPGRLAAESVCDGFAAAVPSAQGPRQLGPLGYSLSTDSAGGGRGSDRGFVPVGGALGAVNAGKPARPVLKQGDLHVCRVDIDLCESLLLL